MIFLFFGGFRFLFLLFGVALALIINFFPLLVMGFIAYKLFQTMSKNNTIHSHISGHSSENKQFSELLIRLIVHVVKADNRVDPRELQAIINFFQHQLRMGYGDLLWIRDLLQHALARDASLESICTEINTHFGDDEKRLSLELIYRIAAADGDIDVNENLVIEQIVRKLNISEAVHSQIRAMFASAQSTKPNYYDVLGLKPPADKDTLKKAYRKASKENHPDKVAHLGQSYQKAAEEKMQKINEAYDKLSKTLA